MRKYTCKTCDAELYWDSQSNCLKCEYCDSTFNPREFNDSFDPNEDGKAEKVANGETANDDSYDVNLVKYKCNECGAEIITAEGTIATTCVYCGRAISMTSKMVGLFKPDLVIPFALTKEQAKNRFLAYCKRSKLVPKEFSNPENLKKIKGIYAPYWLHSFTADADAEIDCENVETKRYGDDKVILHHQYLVSIEAEGYFEKVPTDALKHLDNKLMDAIEPFNYEHLKKFHSGYMAGFYAEEFDETASQTLDRVKERSKQVMGQKMLGEAGTYKHKTLRRYNDIYQDYQTYYAMLPVWLIHVDYKGTEYIFAINGDTGKVTGKLPISNKKFGLALGSVLLGTQLIAFLFRLLEVLL